jgi:hypothetical protein
MAVKLKEETILNQWSMLVDGAAGCVTEVLDAIQLRLMEADIPGHCTWRLDEVQAGGILSRVRREFLVVELEQFPDYRNYVGVRRYGKHLDLCRYLTVEPGFLKRQLSQAITGGDDRLLSTPKNLLHEQDLSAWATVVHHAVIGAVRRLHERLGRDPAGIRTDTKGFLQVW